MPDTFSTAVSRLHDWHNYLSALRQRRLWVWKDLEQTEALAPLWQAFEGPHMWLGDEPPTALPSSVHFLNMQQARTQLGREIGTLVIDARTQVDADAFGAVAGALNGGGIAILLMSEGNKDEGIRRFQRWCQRILADDANVLTVPAAGLAALPIPPASAGLSLDVCLPEVSLSLSPVWQSVQRQALTRDQTLALEVLHGATQRSLTQLIAERGRGKSAVLGMAVAAWLQDGPFDTLWLTAPRAAAVDALFERVQCLCPEGVHEGSAFRLGDRHVQFIAPDALTQCLHAEEAEPPALLLVDEAAALPLPFLKYWLTVCPHIVLSTTQHGYEGSAHGFSHYLRGVGRELAQRSGKQDDAKQGYCLYEMLTPIRWAVNDPLESLTARMLCLDAAPRPRLDDGTLRIEKLKQEQLLAQPELLCQVFGLLREAHYRTSPSDLQTLLDHPALTLWVALRDAKNGAEPQVIAVIMTFDEGGLPAELAQAVADGRRRPPGHLLPQTLALHTGHADVACQRWRRITRIAVHAQCRRQGIGSRMLAHVLLHSQQEGIDQLGVSFGSKRSTLSFWQRNGFTVVRVGLKDDTVTGERAIMMARGCVSAGTVSELSAVFWPTFITQLAFELTTLPPLQVAALLQDEHMTLPVAEVAEQEAVRRFGEEKAPLASVRSLLQQALLRYASTLSLAECAVIAGVLLQGRSASWARAQLPHLAGKRAFEQWLRAKVAQWARYSAS